MSEHDPEILKIDERGYLSILRKGKYQQQYCPYQSSAYCGTWCPLFREPSEVIGNKSKRLELCNITFIATLCDKR